MGDTPARSSMAPLECSGSAEALPGGARTAQRPKRGAATCTAQVIKNMGTTLGACGDVNRNVLAPPAPFKNRPE